MTVQTGFKGGKDLTNAPMIISHIEKQSEENAFVQKIIPLYEYVIWPLQFTTWADHLNVFDHPIEHGSDIKT